MKKILSIIKKKKVWIPLAVVAVIVVIILLSQGGGNGQKTVAVERGTVVSEVDLTGKIKPTQNTDLALERSGRIQNIYVALGETVSEGKTLLEIENSDLRAQVAQASAQYDSQVARLNELKKGASTESLAISETLLANTYQTALDALYDAYNKSEDAVRTQTAGLFLYDEEYSPMISFDSTQTDAKIFASQYRYQSRIYLAEFRDELWPTKAQDRTKIESLLGDTQIKIKYFLQLFSYLDTALNDANGLESATLSAYKSYLTAGRTELNVALSSISAKEQAIANAKRESELKKAGSTTETIAYQEAQVAQALANVQYVQSQLGKTIVRSPFSGVVTKIPYKKGDIVQPQQTVVSVIGMGAYQVETNITESDIAKIKIGDIAKITLDAYTEDVVFEAKVAQIDLSETVLDGVPTYKTTLQLTQEDSRIIPGMTANIDIVSEQKDSVLFVPTRNIISKDGKRFVKKMLGENWEETEVKTGLRGSDGRTEIISGLNEGDTILAE